MGHFYDCSDPFEFKLSHTGVTSGGDCCCDSLGVELRVSVGLNCAQLMT